MRISTFIAPGNKPCCQPLEIFELCADVRPGAVGSFISAIQPAACLVAIAWLSSVVLQCNCDSDTFSTLALPGLANDAVDFGERGPLARSFRRRAENLSATRNARCGAVCHERKPVGGTPTGATETVALPLLNCIVLA